MDTAIAAAVEAWLNAPAIAAADKQEIRALQARGDEKELTDRFYRDLEFGTGGMRGVIEAGLNRMNVYTVGAAAQGLANHLKKRGKEAMKAGVAIAYDCRRKSDVFALRTASVLAGNGITAYLFERLRPTPELSFAVRHLGCAAGVVVTASHNPPEYNGFKVYGADGCQVVPPEDDQIIAEVRGVGGFGNVKLMDPKQADEEGLIRIVGGNIDGPFLDAVKSTVLAREACQTMGKALTIVYTPLHGTGVTLIPEALRRRGFEKVIIVPEQAEPNGEFPTVASPNPEEGAAFKLGIELARKEDADLVIATRPGCRSHGHRRPGGRRVRVTDRQSHFRTADVLHLRAAQEGGQASGQQCRGHDHRLRRPDEGDRPLLRRRSGRGAHRLQVHRREDSPIRAGGQAGGSQQDVHLRRRGKLRLHAGHLHTRQGRGHEYGFYCGDGRRGCRAGAEPVRRSGWAVCPVRLLPGRHEEYRAQGQRRGPRRSRR